ncbi:MAG: SDR family NAD(P)-dependent oxidoreductase, partial [Gammaproteobacteria bacterium]
MNLGIEGKCAAVAAGSAGLGLGAAKALANEGVRVAICGRDPERLRMAISQLPGSAIAIEGDVSSPKGGRAFIDAANEQFGQIDILVTNAGGPPQGTFATTEEEDYQIGRAS